MKDKTKLFAVTGFFLMLHFILIYLDFQWTVDDAYITLRYAENFVAESGIFWNSAGNPVEGYSSTTQFSILAAALTLQLDPIFSIKIIGIISSTLTILLVSWFGYKMNVDIKIVSFLISMIALNPTIALHSTSGMSTPIGLLLVTASSIFSFLTIEKYSTSRAVTMCSLLSVSVITRPDLVIYAGPLVAATVAILWRIRQSFAKQLIIISGLLNGVVGSIYMLSRRMYFGYWFPNPFYIKNGNELIHGMSVSKVSTFGAQQLTIIIVIALIIAIFRQDNIQSKFTKILPLAISIVLHLGLWFFISQSQNYVWRFQAPILGAVIVGSIIVCRDITLNIQNENSANKIATIILVLLVCVYPIHTYHMTSEVPETKPIEQREKIGKTLHEFSDENYVLATTEAGAIPYFSDWHSVDIIGLNHEIVAQNGLSQSYLSRKNPHVIIMLEPYKNLGEAETIKFVRKNQYRLLAGIKRDKTRNSVIVKKQLDKEIKCSLLTMSDVTYIDRRRTIAAGEINTSEITRENCMSYNQN
jgi:hypothetical protein